MQSVDECDRREYEKFLRQFSLSSQAVEIGTILDEEPDVPRYYAELVPAVMIPEEFWSRFFGIYVFGTAALSHKLLFF